MINYENLFKLIYCPVLISAIIMNRFFEKKLHFETKHRFELSLAVFPG
jgi:hypothetical protein